MHDEACDPTTGERNKPEDDPHRYELCIQQIQQPVRPGSRERVNESDTRIGAK